jgi:hypothetical protein
MVGTHHFGSTLRALVDQPCMLFQGSRALYGALEWVLFIVTLALALIALPGVRAWL